MLNAYLCTNHQLSIASLHGGFNEDVGDEERNFCIGRVGCDGSGNVGRQLDRLVSRLRVELPVAGDDGRAGHLELGGRPGDAKRGRGEGSGRADENGGNGELHC